MRSLLFVPADSEKKLAKSLGFGADCLIVDLEDSVAPSAKDKARETALAFLAQTSRLASRPQLYVRVNGLDSGLIEADLDAVMSAAPDGLMLPKCEGKVAVQHLGAMLAVKEAEHDLADGATKIIPIVTETAASMFVLGTYVGASPRLAGLAWGAEDLSACLGAQTYREPGGAYSPPYALARTLSLLAASAAGVAAIDTVYPDFGDDAGFRSECEAGRRDGFFAKMAIHPAQVAIINAVFTPSPEDVANARAIVEAFAAERGAGVIAFKGKMLDRPHLAKAERLLANANLIAALERK
jgi:citrate lyase subunit beta/citryl-CoA lyase